MMSFGFPPSSKKTIYFKDIKSDVLLTAVYFSLIEKRAQFYGLGPYGGTAIINSGWSSMGEQIKFAVSIGTIEIESSSLSGFIFDWGKNQKNIFKLEENIKQFINNNTEETFLEKKIQLQKAIESLSQTNRENSYAQIVEPTRFLSVFLPVKNYLSTPILIYFNIVLFLAMVISGVSFFNPTIDDLLKWGSNFRPVTLDGGWWRLLSSIFIHIGILHLLFNVYALSYIGLILEPIIGAGKLAFAYILSGLMGNLASVWYNDVTVSAGASGAIFGLYGLFVVLILSNKIDSRQRKPLLFSTVIFIIYSLLNGFRANSGIDNAAHVGGLFAGLATGLAYIPMLNEESNFSIKGTVFGGLTIGAYVLVIVTLKSISNDIPKYLEGLEKFAGMESMGMEFFNLPANTPKEDLLNEIDKRSLYYWNENLELIKSFKKLSLPNHLMKRNELLESYCKARIEVFKLLYKTISEETNKYGFEINQKNIEIERLLHQLKVLENSK